MDQLQNMRRRAQILRKNMTKEERHLWYDFLKTYPIQFKRQYQIGSYYVDFYCYQAKLIIELDGSQHCDPEAVAYDNTRTAYLQKQGFFVLRLSNRDVTEKFRSVCEEIDNIANSRIRG